MTDTLQIALNKLSAWKGNVRRTGAKDGATAQPVDGLTRHERLVSGVIDEHAQALIGDLDLHSPSPMTARIRATARSRACYRPHGAHRRKCCAACRCLGCCHCPR